MKVSATSVAGEALFSSEAADPSWTLENVLEQVPEGPALKRRRILVESRELERGMTLGDLGVRDAANLTVVAARRPCIVTAAGPEAKIWCAETGRCLQTFRGHFGEVYFVLVSPDQEVLLAVDGVAHLWSATSGARLHALCDGQKRVRSGVFSQDGALVLARTMRDTTLWSRSTGQLLHRLEGTAAVFSPCGEQVLTACRGDSSAKLWSSATGERLHTLAGTGRLDFVGFSPDGSLILTACEAKFKLWSAATRACLRTLDGGQLSFSPDGNRLLVASPRELKVVDASTGSTLCWLPLRRRCRGVAFSPDGRQAIIADEEETSLWSCQTGEAARCMQGGPPVVHWSPNWAPPCSHDGWQLLNRTERSTLQLWSTESGQCLRSWRPHPTNHLVTAVFSP